MQLHGVIDPFDVVVECCVALLFQLHFRGTDRGSSEASAHTNPKRLHLGPAGNALQYQVLYPNGGR